MSANANLHKAKNAKNDEFYTQLSDVEKELMHYKEYFRDKVVLCNCDDPTWSAFWKYFHLNFEILGLKKLVATHYDPTQLTYKMEYTGGNDAEVEVGVKSAIDGHGDFRSPQCIKLLKECDVVVTNPPFSLARVYIDTLMTHHKQFLIVGDMNWVTCKDVFPLVKANKLWLGNCMIKEFIQPDGTLKKFGNKLWFTNLDHKKRHEKLVLWKHYTPEEYPKYDNYDASNVNKVSDIPCDYYESIGVPITILDKLNSEQFEIVGADFDLANPIKLENGKTGTGRFYVTVERESAFIRTNCNTKEEIVNILHTAGVTEDMIFYRNGVMGVPISFLNGFYNPKQFKIIGMSASWCEHDTMKLLKISDKHRHNPIMKNKEIYRRIFIKREDDK